MKRIVCFGEMLLRLSSAGRERLFQSAQLSTYFGGAEANVAVAMARLGNAVEMVSALPDNAVGRACLEHLRRQRIGTEHIVLGEGRMGLYFLEAGAMQRASQITYDRQDTVFTLTEPNAYDWGTILSGADALHVCGITLAVSEAAFEASLAAVTTARELGIRVAFDCNYRAALWKGREDRATDQILSIIEKANILFGGARDAQLLLGHQMQDEPPLAQFESAANAFRQRFPSLDAICSTYRETLSADSHKLTGCISSRSGLTASRTYELHNIVDRIGGGDAFAGGTLHKLLQDAPDDETISFGVASAVMKHSIPGDANLTDEQEVSAIAMGGGLDVKR